MPFIEIKLSAGRSPETKREISKDMTESLVRHTGCSEDKVWIVFNDVNDEDWVIGGISIAEIKAKA